MSSGEKRFPPSELKLERLRSSGIVPRCPHVITAGVVIALPLVLSSSLEIFLPDITDLSTKAFSSDTFVRADLLNFFWLLFYSSVVAIGVVAAVVLLVGGIQNRFLFAWSALSVDFTRLFSLGGGSARNRLFSLLGKVTLVVIWVFVATVVLRYCLGAQRLQVLEFAEQSVTDALSGVKNTFFVLAGSLILVSFFVAIVSRILAVWSFRKDHFMTRQELEAEYREAEGNPQRRR